jgi:hypothetical protein
MPGGAAATATAVFDERRLSPAMRDGLVLWLDPTTLGAPGSVVDVWCDRSGLGHHGYPAGINATATPLRVGTEDRSALSVQLQGSLSLEDNWLYVSGPGEELSFGTEDFLVLVAVSVLHEADLATPESWGETALFNASGLGRYSLLLVADPSVPEVRASMAGTGIPSPVEQGHNLFDAQSRLHGLYRRGLVFSYRLNGVSQGHAESPGSIDLSSPANLVAIGSSRASFSAYIQVSALVTATVIFRGPLDIADVTRTEDFLCKSLGSCAPTKEGDAGAP